MLPEKELVGLTKEIHALLSTPCIIEGMKGFGERRICVFFQGDLMKYGLGEEVLIEIKGYKEYPHFETAMIFQKLAELVKSKIKIDGEPYVECRIPSNFSDNELVTFS